MTDFRIKTLRCEWQVVIQQVDQYGCSLRDGCTILAVWPTCEQAYADLPYYGHEDSYVRGRWIPKGALHAYEYLEVQYREVEVK
jgi:hypothetical protein